LTCHLCGKMYAFCLRHRADVSRVMSGHVLRVHPETVAVAKFDELLHDERAMSTLRTDAAKRPEEWAYFFEYVAERQAGRPARSPKEVEAAESKAIREEAERVRGRAVEAPGSLEPIRWYDGAWEFLLSYGGEASPLWMFSAKLFPYGRGSVKGDWDRLGCWTAAVGVPRGEREMGKTIDTSPGGVHKWMWGDAKNESETTPQSKSAPSGKGRSVAHN
jgi:hypothetical protein